MYHNPLDIFLVERRSLGSHCSLPWKHRREVDDLVWCLATGGPRPICSQAARLAQAATPSWPARRTSCWCFGLMATVDRLCNFMLPYGRTLATHPWPERSERCTKIRINSWNFLTQICAWPMSSNGIALTVLPSDDTTLYGWIGSYRDQISLGKSINGNRSLIRTRIHMSH